MVYLRQSDSLTWSTAYIELHFMQLRLDLWKFAYCISSHPVLIFILTSWMYGCHLHRVILCISALLFSPILILTQYLLVLLSWPLLLLLFVAYAKTTVLLYFTLLSCFFWPESWLYTWRSFLTTILTISFPFATPNQWLEHYSCRIAALDSLITWLTLNIESMSFMTYQSPLLNIYSTLSGSHVYIAIYHCLILTFDHYLSGLFFDYLLVPVWSSACIKIYITCWLLPLITTYRMSFLTIDLPFLNPCLSKAIYYMIFTYVIYLSGLMNTCMWGRMLSGQLRWIS